VAHFKTHKFYRMCASRDTYLWGVVHSIHIDRERHIYTLKGVAYIYIHTYIYIYIYIYTFRCTVVRVVAREWAHLLPPRSTANKTSGTLIWPKKKLHCFCLCCCPILGTECTARTTRGKIGHLQFLILWPVAGRHSFKEVVQGAFDTAISRDFV